MPEPLILGFDTSAAHCAAALLRGDSVVCQRAEAMGKGQAERLMPMLEELLAEAGAGWRDLAVIGVGTGPGNFTGIRLAVSAARGLSMALGIPAVGIGTLEAMAFGAPRPALALSDARRGALYAQRFEAQRAAAPQLTDGDALGPLDGITVIGDGALHPAAQAPRLPVAEAIARCAAARRHETPDAPRPIYLRSADAAPPRDPAPIILP